MNNCASNRYGKYAFEHHFSGCTHRLKVWDVILKFERSLSKILAIYFLMFGMLGLLECSSWAASGANTQNLQQVPANKSPSSTVTSTGSVSMPVCSAPSKANIAGFWAFPDPRAQYPAREGTPITFSFSIKNLCNYPLTNIPWRIDRFATTILSGVQPYIAAGATVDVLDLQWTAIPGTHNFFLFVDPNRQIGTGSEIKWVLDYRVPMTPRWADWLAKAKTGTVEGINNWISRSRIDGKVESSAAIFPIGFLTSEVAPGGDIDIRIFNAGVPREYAPLIAGAIGDAWSAWARNLVAPTNPVAFPAFVVYFINPAPPTPAIPPILPFLPAISSAEGGLGADSLSRSIKARLGLAATQTGADAAINDFAQWFSSCFTAWKRNATISNITGFGPVPSLAPGPTAVPGPVLGGFLTAKLGGARF